MVWGIGWLLALPTAQATWTTKVSYVKAATVPAPVGTKRAVFIDPAVHPLNPADRTSLQQAVRAFRNQASRAQNFEVKYVPALDRRDLSVTPDWDQLARIAGAHRAEVVITFDRLTYEMTRPDVQEVMVPVEREGVTREERRFDATREVTAVLDVRFVDPRSRETILAQDVRHGVTISARSKTRNAAVRDLEVKSSKQKARLAVLGAEWLGRQIFATRITGTRTFFANGKLKEGRKYAAVGKWIDARKAWRKHWDNGKKSGMKARFNVAVTFEVRGNVRHALKVLDPLVGRWNKSLVRNYHRQLKQRVANLDRLEQQGLR
jgi:hypothetical protein